MPIAVLSEYTEKEYEPFDPYSRFYPAMPISVCFSDTALYTLGKCPARFCYCHITKDGNLLYERSKSRGTELSVEKDLSITEFSF